MKTCLRMWRKLWPSLLVLGLVVFARPVFAQAWSIPEFQADITINQDASIDVVEVIRVDFGTAKHGIYRTIPFRYTVGDNSTVSVPLTIRSVRMDGRSIKYTERQSGNDVTLKIGDPNTTITGAHVYTIDYTAQAAINFFSDHDELYWNVTGSDWEVPIQSVSASVHWPSQVSADQQRVGCYTGAIGSRARDCLAQAETGQATFSAQDFLTVVVGAPPGTVTKPANYDTLRTSAGQSEFTRRFLSMPIMSLNLLILLGSMVGIVVAWRRYGRDPRSRGTVIAQYEPPAGLRPGEVGVVFNERANQRDLSATIIDLAVRGYLEITEIEKKHALGLGHSTDYKLNLKKSINDSALQPYEQQMLKGLFGTAKQQVLSDRKGKMHTEVKQAQTGLYQRVVRLGLFDHNPQRTRWTFAGVGIALLFSGFWIVPSGIVAVPVMGLVFLIAAPFMPKRTKAGVDAYWQARGFKLFLEKAEKYRLKWQEKEHIFEQYLPYAMVFGVADKWSKAFKDLQQAPPDWYHGAAGGQFNTLLLWSALSNFTSVSAASFAPPAASGSSGFGGGGFSGGGFGGGGGGSW